MKTSRFTVCPIWPLWNTPNIYFNVRFGASCRIRTNDPEITNHVLWPTELKRRVLFRFFVTPFYTSAEKRCKSTAFFLTDQIFFKKNAFLPSFFIKRGANAPLLHINHTYFYLSLRFSNCFSIASKQSSIPSSNVSHTF